MALMTGSILSLTLAVTAAAALQAPPGCAGFRACNDAGQTALAAGDSIEALRYYGAACDMTVTPPLGALHIAACERIVTLSAAVDHSDYAQTFFGPRCHDGSAKDCLFLGRLEERRDSLARALTVLTPLCDDGFALPAVHGYEACAHVDRINAALAIRHPRPARDERLQLYLALAFFIATGVTLILTSAGGSSNSHLLALAAIAFALFAGGIYWYYERGIPRFADIRIDLLLILPALALNTVAVGVSLRRLLRRPGDGRDAGVTP